MSARLSAWLPGRVGWLVAPVLGANALVALSAALYIACSVRAPLALETWLVAMAASVVWLGLIAGFLLRRLKTLRALSKGTLPLSTASVTEALSEANGVASASRQLSAVLWAAVMVTLSVVLRVGGRARLAHHVESGGGGRRVRTDCVGDGGARFGPACFGGHRGAVG